MATSLVRKIKDVFSLLGQWSFCLIPFVLFMLAACTNPERAENGSNQEKTDGKVIAISDGDTFRLLTDEKQTVRVRMHGIDAPEKAQDFGTRARQELSDFIFNKEVRIEQKSKDRYGRTVAIVYVDGRNVNEEMLRRGMVWHYKDYDKNETWAQLEQRARESKTGLWQQPHPTAPWQFRKEKRMEREEAKAVVK